MIFADNPHVMSHIDRLDPAVWRIVLGLGVAYQIFLVILLFQVSFLHSSACFLADIISLRSLKTMLGSYFDIMMIR